MLGSPPPTQKSLHCSRKAMSAKIITVIMMNIPESTQMYVHSTGKMMGFFGTQAMNSHCLPLYSKALNPSIKEILGILQITSACIQYTKNT